MPLENCMSHIGYGSVHRQYRSVWNDSARGQRWLSNFHQPGNTAMKLNDSQINRLKSYLAEFTQTQKNCPWCGEKTWILDGTVYEHREYNEGNLIIGGANNSIFPVIPLVCSKCGYVIWLNAFISRALAMPGPDTATNTARPDSASQRRQNY